MLAILALPMGDCRTLVTFNGKSFDWPMVLERAAYHRLARQSSDDATDLRAFTSEYRLVHCDLLHHARRRWRGRLPNCRLQTLERFVCRRHRVDDIAGGRIPQEYHHFVRTRDARRMAEVLEHNALDLVTLVELAIRLARPNGGVPTAT